MSLGTLPSSVTAGSPSSVTVTIRDDEGRIRVSLSPTAVRVNEGQRFSLRLVFSRQPHETHGWISLISEDRCTRRLYRYHELVTGIGFVRRSGWSQSIKNINTGNVREDTVCTIRIDEAKLRDDYLVGDVGTVTITIVNVPNTKGDGDDPPPEDRQSPPDTGETDTGEETQDSEQTDDCGEDDRENLVRFYDATDGDNWDEEKKTHWNSEQPLDQWYGVETDDEENVVSLRLSDSGLSGEMPGEELLCLYHSELKELALWDNDGLSGEEPEELVPAVERAVLRDIAETLDLNPEWFDDYEDPFSFEDWHPGVTTDEDGRVVELDLSGEDIEGVIPGSVFQLQRLVVIERGCGVTLEVEEPERVSVMMSEGCEEIPEETPDEAPTSGGGGCALGQGNSSVSALFLLTLLVFGVFVRRRARG